MNIILNKRSIIFYFIFIIAGSVIIAAFITATSYKQLALAALFYPLLVFFALILFPRKAQAPPSGELLIAPPPVSNHVRDEHTSEKETVIADIDKRAFLKLIAGTGVSYLVYSFFARRAESFLFGKDSEPGTVALQTPNGNTIHPAETQPTDGYQIAEIDEGEPSYFGFVDTNGAWFIMREDEAGSFRYTKGASSFPTSWSVRKQLKYNYYHLVFPKDKN